LEVAPALVFVEQWNSFERVEFESRLCELHQAVVAAEGKETLGLVIVVVSDALLVTTAINAQEEQAILLHHAGDALKDIGELSVGHMEQAVERVDGIEGCFLEGQVCKVGDEGIEALLLAELDVLGR
jgi:hypothetical protein